ncbi:MAG: hypothetical protein LLF94_12175, partial [Chlamydiales bacterium]|nr:hypothetical protein [Chlamydiales bacterium]
MISLPPVLAHVGPNNTFSQEVSPEQALRGNSVDTFIESLSKSDFSKFSISDLQATILVLLRRNQESDRTLLFQALPYFADLYSQLDECAFIYPLNGELDEAITEYVQEEENLPIDWESIYTHVCSEKNEAYDLVGLFSNGFREWKSKCFRNPKDHVEMMKCMGELEKAAVRRQNNSPECTLENLPTEIYDPFYVDFLKLVLEDHMWEMLTREPQEKANTLFRWLLNLAHSHSRTDYVELLYLLMAYIKFEPAEWTSMKVRMREIDFL